MFDCARHLFLVTPIGFSRAPVLNLGWNLPKNLWCIQKPRNYQPRARTSVDMDGVDNIQVMVDDKHVLDGMVEFVLRRRAKYHDYIVFLSFCIGIRLQTYSRPIL